MKKIFASFALLIMLAFALIGCAQDNTFAARAGFTVKDVYAVKVTNAYRVSKDLSEYKEEIFFAFAESELTEGGEIYDSDWGVDYSYRVDFYLEGYDGYYSVVLNKGMRFMEGYDNKDSAQGSFTFSDADGIAAKLSSLFYR